MMVARRRFFVALAAAVLAGIAVTVTGSSAAPRTLASLLVRPAQMGPGYHATNGTFTGYSGVESLGCLHLRKPPRHMKTVGREYDRQTSAVLNVLFRYPTDRGAANSIASLLHILTACPTIKLRYTSGKTSLTVAVKLTRVRTPAGLLPHSIALQEDTVTDGQRGLHGIDVYQPDGNILSLVFAFAPHPRALVAHAARASAHNLG